MKKFKTLILMAMILMLALACAPNNSNQQVTEPTYTEQDESLTAGKRFYSLKLTNNLFYQFYATVHLEISKSTTPTGAALLIYPNDENVLGYFGTVMISATNDNVMFRIVNGNDSQDIFMDYDASGVVKFDVEAIANKRENTLTIDITDKSTNKNITATGTLPANTTSVNFGIDSVSSTSGPISFASVKFKGYTSLF